MKTIALAVVALFFTLTTLFPSPAVDCERRAACIRDCDAALQRALDALAPQRRDIEQRGEQWLRDCRSNHTPGSVELRRCEEAVNERVQETVRQIEAPVRAAHRRCVAGCSAQNRDCIQGPSDFLGSIDIECTPGGAPCFKPVSKFCAQIDGACGDCLRSLCGGGEWTFDSELPLTVTLLAAVDPLQNPRVIATSTPGGVRSLLAVPPGIKLGEKEKLYFGFASKEGLKRTFKVSVHRDKKP